MDHDRHEPRTACSSSSAAADGDIPVLSTWKTRREVRSAVSSTNGSRTARGEEVGGIVPQITLESIANNEPPAEEVLVDRPEVEPKHHAGVGAVHRRGDDPAADRDARRRRRRPARSEPEADGKFADRMLEVLRKSPVLRLEGNRTVTLKNVRPPAKTLSLSAEAIVRTGEEDKPVAFVFGPENGAVTETLVHQALREAQHEGVRPPLRHRLRDPAERPQADRRCGADGHPGDLRAGDARPDDGRPAQEHAVEPDLQRLRPARGQGPPGAEGWHSTRSNCSASTCSTR